MIAYAALVCLPVFLAALAMRWMPPEAAGAVGLAAALLAFLVHGRSATTLAPGRSAFPRDAAIAVLSGAFGQIAVLGSFFLAARFGGTGLTWHPALQIAAVVVGADFLGYWSHRLVHRVPALWPIHIMHHAPERLYWLNGLRSHPIDSLLTSLIIVPWAVFLGFSRTSLILSGLIVTCHLMLQHAVVKLPSRFGFLFATPDWHIVHHDRDLAGKPVHLGRIFSFWDRLFGTAAPGRARPAALGLPGRKATSLLSELAVPFGGGDRRNGGRIPET